MNKIKTIFLFLVVLASPAWAMIHSISFISAAQQGSYDRVRDLVQLGAPIDSRDDRGRTALHYAAELGNQDIAEYLVAQGALVDNGDPRGHTPFFDAAMKGHLKVIEFLFSHGASIDFATQDGMTPLMLPAYFCHFSVVQFLVQNGALLNHADINGDTALMWAVGALLSHEHNRHEIVQLLINRGASVVHGNINGQTALTKAIERNRIECAYLIIDHLMKIPNAKQRKRILTILLCVKKVFGKDIYSLFKVSKFRDLIEQENRANPEHSVAFREIGKIGNQAMKQRLIDKYIQEKELYIEAAPSSNKRRKNNSTDASREQN